jgi:hypothetical protein
VTGPDVIMLSYDEPLAGVLHARLEIVLRCRVKRLHGVTGMRRAYRLCAEIADRDEFLLADGDLEIADRFDPGRIAPLGAGVAMRVWQTANPVNGLVYGYGGLKLISRAALRQLGEAVDVLAGLPGRTEFTAETAGTTRIDQSPLHAWRAGFRECAMLASGSEYGMSDHGARRRLDAWLAGGRGPCAAHAAAGAAAGVAFAREAAGDAARLRQINDPAWLLARFTAASKGQAPR